MVAETEVERFVDHWPAHCSDCGHRFVEDERSPSASPRRHQVSELPEIAVEIDEHRAHELRCPRCGHTTRATGPQAVASSAFGPRLEAAIALLSVRHRVSRRGVS